VNLIGQVAIWLGGKEVYFFKDMIVAIQKKIYYNV
jgi:hypothetical protein